MKTQTYGLCDSMALTYHPCHFQYSRERIEQINEGAMRDYIRCRLNGGFLDILDLSTFPHDGVYRCDPLIPGAAFSEPVRPVRYVEGPQDKAWMEAHDRSYVFSLERERKLEEVEPNLSIEVPKLYEEVMDMRKNFQLLSKLLRPEITTYIIFPLIYPFSGRKENDKFIGKTIHSLNLFPFKSMSACENSSEKKARHQNQSFLPNFPKF